MRRIIEIIKNKFIKKHIIPPLGRWNIEYCNKKINKKIDFSNEDHCGPCGQYILTEIILNDKKIK